MTATSASILRFGAGAQGLGVSGSRLPISGLRSLGLALESLILALGAKSRSLHAHWCSSLKFPVSLWYILTPERHGLESRV